MNPGTCDGCRWHSHNPEGSLWTNEDGTPRDDLCSCPEWLRRERTSEPIPVLNWGCKRYSPQEARA